MVEEYIKDLETIETEVKTISKNKNATLSQKQTLIEMIQKHEILWLTSLHILGEKNGRNR